MRLKRWIYPRSDLQYKSHTCCLSLVGTDSRCEIFIYMDEEIWNDIPGWEWYKVSTLWRVYSCTKIWSWWHTWKIKSACIDPGWYPTVNLFNKEKRCAYKIHRLVAQSFISNPENKPCINHKNGIKHDNRVENLEWCTQSENIFHSINILWNKTFFQKNKVAKIWWENHNAKIILQYTLTWEFIKEWWSIADASRSLKIPTTNISKVCMGNRKKAWWFIFTYQEKNGK